MAVKIARVRFLYARFANGKPGSTLTAYEEPVKFVKSPCYVTIDIRVFLPQTNLSENLLANLARIERRSVYSIAIYDILNYSERFQIPLIIQRYL